MYEARHVRPRWEVEALLMSAVAEAEARRKHQREAEGRHDPVVIENPDDEPAPAWVNQLPVT
jgi:hypothetical protein